MYKKTVTILFLFISSCIYCQNPNTVTGYLKKLETAKDADKPNIYTQICSFYIYEQKYDSVLIYSNLCLDLCKRIGDEKGLANAYVLLGSVSLNTSNNKKAMDFFLKALKIYEKNNLYKNASKTLANISRIFSDELKYDQALENIFQAVTYGLKAKDTVILLSLYATISYDYTQIKNIEKAHYYLNKAEELLNYELKKGASGPVDPGELMFWKTQVNALKAQVYREEGRFQEAINIHKQNLEEGENSPGIQQKIEALNGISENYYRLKQYLPALEYSNKALALLKTDSVPYAYMESYLLQSKIFAGMKRYEDAYKFHVLYKDISDSILNRQNFESISNLKINYETEKKEQEISTLNKKRETQKLITGLVIAAFVITLGFLFFAYRSKTLQQKLFKQNAETKENERFLEKALLEKKMNELEQMALNAQMNPHFIFNSLNSVQHFVVNKDVEGVNRYLGAFAHLIRQTLNNSGKQVISLDEEVKYLETYLLLEKIKSNNSFNYSIRVTDNIEQSETFMPAMILQPYVENSIRHGITHKKNDNGFIDIDISKNGKLVFVITDNGVGRQKAGEIKMAAEEPIYQSKGMDITKRRIDAINKIYNTNILVQVNDKIDLNGNLDGTSVRLEFPADME